METPNLTVTEIKEQLTEIDESDTITVNSWEADFLNSILHMYKGRQTMSPSQRESCIRIIRKYPNP